MRDAVASDDPGAAIAVGEQWLSAFPDRAEPYRAQFRAHWRVRNAAAAIATFEAGLARFPQDGPLLLAAAIVHEAQGDLDKASHALLRRAECEKLRADSFLRLGMLRMGAKDVEGAEQAFDTAIAAGAPLSAVRVKLAAIALLRRDISAGLSLLDTQEAETGPSPEIDKLRNKLRKRARIQAEQAHVAPRALKTAATGELRAWAARESVPTLAPHEDAPRLITPTGDLLIERAYDSRALVLVFGGLASMFGSIAEDLGDLVPDRPINKIFVTDPRRLLSLHGFATVGDYEASLGWLRSLADLWSIRRFYCFGLSAGGYSALRYGIDLPATRILTFAAPTAITRDWVNRDTRATAIANRLLSKAPEMCRDLRPELEARGANAPEIISYFGDEAREDAMHARNFQGLQTVSLRPIENLSAHAVGRSLRADGQYERLMAEFLRDSEI